MAQESAVLITYELQCSIMNDAVWIHASDGSTVGRMGRQGVDLHNSVSDQLLGKPECRLCTHGKPTHSDWKLFREKALEWWNIVVPEDAFRADLLQ